MLKVDIITLFPDIFFGPFAESIIARALKEKKVEINTVDLREFTTDKRRSVDDRPYGGGPGMLMAPEPIFKAVEALRTDRSLVVLVSPQRVSPSGRAWQWSCPVKSILFLFLPY